MRARVRACVCFLKSGASPPQASCLSQVLELAVLAVLPVLRPASGWVPHRTEAGDE